MKKILYHYQINSIYLVKGEPMKLCGFTNCPENNEQEICTLCPGKLLFPDESIRCGWIYNDKTKDYEPFFKKCKA